MSETKLKANQVCSVDGCDSGVAHGGLCSRHYYNELDERRLRLGYECSWPDCSRAPRTRGFCTRHYHRIKFSRDLEIMLPAQFRAPRCRRDDCDNPMYAKDLCRKHYGRKDPDQSDPPDPSNRAPLNWSRVRAAAICANLSISEVYAAIGVSHQAVTYHLRHGGVPEYYLDPIARTLGVPVEWLLRENPPRLVIEEIPVEMGENA